MNIKLKILFAIFTFVFSCDSQSKEYSVFLSARLIMDNSLDHNVRRKFAVNKNETIEIVFANPTKATKNKYILSFTILSETGENFTAAVEVLERYYHEKSNKTAYKKILQLDTPGEFFEKNNYSLTSLETPDLIIGLELKKKLSLDEMKKIFDKKN